MEAKFYLCYSSGGGVEFGVEPGSYVSPEARLEDARKTWNGDYGLFDKDSGEDNLFWLDIDENGVPTMGCFLDSDFEEDDDELNTAAEV
jgi:hypothetical protein